MKNYKLSEIRRYVSGKFGKQYLKYLHPILWDSLHQLSSIYKPKYTQQAARAMDLNHLLRKYKPKRIVEFGMGFSTIIFAKYAQEHGARFTSYDENPEWISLIKETLAKHNIDIPDLLLSEKVLDKEKCHYLASAPIDGDFYYVDGPANTLDGITSSPCLDMSLALERGAKPHIIVVDGRTSTVDTLKIQDQSYTWLSAFKYAQHHNLPGPDRIGLHTIAIKN